MPENPLLPSKKLRELYHRVELAAKAVRTSFPRGEAVLAAAASHLEPGDLALTHLELPQLPAPRGKAPATATVGTAESGLAIAATGAAAGLRNASTDRIAISLLKAGEADAGWEEAFSWAQRSTLPVVFVFVEKRGPGRPPHGAAGWNAVSQHARKIDLPILTADGEDAVAMFRCFQEAILRARIGGGPSILWALTGGLVAVQGRAQTSPLVRLRRYMKERGIAIE